MAYGAEFYNEGGKIQVASSVSNFFMCQKGSVNVTGSTAVTITPTVPYDGIAVTMNITNPENRVKPLSMFPTTQAANTSQSVAFINYTNFTLTWYAFVNYKTLTPATSGHGMEIYNADGSVGFSTQQPKILKGFKIPILGVPPIAIDGTVSSSKVYAFMQYGTINGPSSSTLGGYKWETYPLIGYKTSSEVAVTWQSRSLGFSPYNGPGFNGGFLVLDVTNY